MTSSGAWMSVWTVNAMRFPSADQATPPMTPRSMPEVRLRSSCPSAVLVKIFPFGQPPVDMSARTNAMRPLPPGNAALAVVAGAPSAAPATISSAAITIRSSRPMVPGDVTPSSLRWYLAIQLRVLPSAGARDRPNLTQRPRQP